jgi:hypothetical protein
MTLPAEAGAQWDRVRLITRGFGWTDRYPWDAKPVGGLGLSDDMKEKAPGNAGAEICWVKRSVLCDDRSAETVVKR